MRVPTGPLVAIDLMVLGVSALAAGEGGPQMFYGFLAIVGGVLGTLGLWAVIGRYAIRKLDALDEKTDQRHADNLAQQQKMWAFLLGVEGVGGLMDDQRRNKKRRHELAQDVTIIFGALGEHTTQIARLSDQAGLSFDPPELDRPRRRADDE